MPRIAPKDGHDKFSRYRAAKQRQGLKMIRLWVPDPAAPGFKDEAERQARILRGAAEEREVLDFIEAATTDLDLEPIDWGPDGPPPWPGKEQAGERR